MSPQQTTAICTVITYNRIAWARTLFESINKHNAEIPCYALVIDPPANIVWPLESGFEILHPHSLRMGNVPDLLFQYTPFELCCALKPIALNHLIEELGYQQAIYLDSDILVLSELDRLIEQFKISSILVTPHLDVPFPDDNMKPDDAHVMLSGIFNLGFIGVKKSNQGKDFLRWWESKLQTGCIEDHFNGVFVDQKYVDIAIGLFDGLYVIRDPGCNVAYWNLHSRHITRVAQQWFSNRTALVFYHFSDFQPSKPDMLSGHQNRHDLTSMPALHALIQYYCACLNSHGVEESEQLPYGYSCYENGRRISRAARRAYLLASPEIRPENPFDSGTHSFRFKFSISKQWFWLQFNRLAHVLLKH